MQIVDFCDQRFLERFKLSVVGKLLVSLPVIQMRKHILHVASCLFLRESFFYHVRHTDVDQIVHVAVRVCAVCVAPFAVCFVRCAVLVLADDFVFKRHTAALAEKLAAGRPPSNWKCFWQTTAK